jgi:hypothetical protein
VKICDILSSYRQARLENAAAPDAGASHKQAVTPAGSGTPAKIQLSDHNLPLRAGDELQTIEWLTRAKSLKAGMIPLVFVRLPPAHRPLLTAPPPPLPPRGLAGSGRMEGSDAQHGYASSMGKPLTAGAATDAAETDTAVDEDDLIAWAT